MRVNDAVIGAALVAFAAALAFHARTFPAIPGQQYGAAVFPALIALGLGACGIGLIVGGLRRWRGVVVWAEWARSGRAWLNLAATFAAILAMILTSTTLGFIPVSIAALVVLLSLLGARWWVALIVAVLVTVLIHQIFSELLRVPLPRGTILP